MSEATGEVTDPQAEVVAPAPGMSALEALEELEAPPQDKPATQPPAEQPADQTPDDPQADWLRPGKFRTVEDALRSYDEVERFAGRLKNDLGSARKELELYQSVYQSPGQAPQQQAPEPQASQYAHPAQGYTPEQLEEMVYTNPSQAVDYLASQRATQVVDQRLAGLEPILAQLLNTQNELGASRAIENLGKELGGDVIDRHRDTLAEIVRRDEGFFLDDQTRQQRLTLATKALEYDRLRTERPRQSNGQFATTAPAQQVFTEGGSNGAAPPVDPNADVHPVIREMRAHGAAHDRFGRLDY